MTLIENDPDAAAMLKPRQYNKANERDYKQIAQDLAEALREMHDTFENSRCEDGLCMSEYDAIMQARAILKRYRGE